MAGVRHRKDAWIVFAFLIVVQIVCFRGSQRLRADLTSQFAEPAPKAWLKRSEPPAFQLLKHATATSTSSAAATNTRAKSSSSSKQHSSTTAHTPKPTSPSKDHGEEPKAPACQPIPSNDRRSMFAVMWSTTAKPQVTLTTFASTTVPVSTARTSRRANPRSLHPKHRVGIPASRHFASHVSS